MGNLVRVIFSGLVAGLMYLVAQAIDLKIARNRVDDRILLGGVAPVSESTARILGTGIHLTNSVLASAVFSSLVQARLAGPNWWRGFVFASVVNLLLYPLVLLEDFHPAIRNGRLDSYQSRTAFLQGVWRHLWLGIVLGSMSRK